MDVFAPNDLYIYCRRHKLYLPFRQHIGICNCKAIFKSQVHPFHHQFLRRLFLLAAKSDSALKEAFFMKTVNLPLLNG